MKLILVHGVGQEETNQRTLRDEWLGSLRDVLKASNDWPDSKVSAIEVPFYGDVLDALTKGLAKGPQTVSQGVDAESDDFAKFAEQDLHDMAIAMGATESQIRAEMVGQTVEQGLPHKAWIKAIARVIEKISPLRGRLALMVLKQAHRYIARPNIAKEIDAIVRPTLAGDEPMIIVAHSLGTVVTYKLLREFAAQGKPRDVPLYVTLGSPLSIDAVRRGFTTPRLRPQAIRRWLNGADRKDFVALRNVLDAKTFGAGPVENISDIDNGDDPHAGVRYLRDPRIAQAISQAIG
jgi:hypothetical protein